MSRAFVKEDVEMPERSGRRRSASGLPPGAVNYMTAHGARRLREELARLSSTKDKDAAEIADLEGVIGSATIVELPQIVPECIVFGATVKVQSADERCDTYRIVGVDEVGFSEGAVSWTSPVGRALVGKGIGDRVSMDSEGKQVGTIVEVEYREPGN